MISIGEGLLLTGLPGLVLQLFHEGKTLKGGHKTDICIAAATEDTSPEEALFMSTLVMKGIYFEVKVSFSKHNISDMALNRTYT